MEKLNADFDDQAGNFSTGSVQTNRQLGETVGGMQMMMSSANALGEFDLRVYVETWVEPVLRQIVKLEQYYESDTNIIAISAKRAKLMPRFGISDVTDDLLTSQVAISVDIGLGSSDPLQSLAKFQQASDIVLKLLGPRATARMKDDAIIDEVYGKAGYRDASERFYNKADEEDARIAEMKQAMQEMQAQMQQMAQALEDKKAELEIEMINRQKDREAKIEVAKIGVMGDVAKQEMANEKEAKNAAQKERTEPPAPPQINLTIPDSLGAALGSAMTSGAQAAFQNIPPLQVNMPPPQPMKRRAIRDENNMIVETVDEPVTPGGAV
jgi:hypothetical protein